MDKIINIKVRNRIAIADPGQCIICGNEDYTAVFEFDDEWNGIETKTARFYRKNNFTDVIFTGNEVVIPEMVNVSNVKIGVFAGDMTTTPAVVRCYKSILCDGGNVAEPDPDVYAQIIKMIENIETGGGGGVDADGITPHIGANGNWYIGETDTGMPSRGEKGVSVTVKSVEESFEDGGINTITFSDGHTLRIRNGSGGGNGDSSQNLLAGTTNDVTPSQVLAAYIEGKRVAITHTDEFFGRLTFTSFVLPTDMNMVAASGIFALNNSVAVCQLLGTVLNDVWNCTVTMLAKETDIPDTNEIVQEVINALPDASGVTY